LRLWSISPKHLDPVGLVALWRESILALRVLEGSTRGYRKHPQLERFRNYTHPLKAASTYAYYVWVEGRRRGFRFRVGKLRLEEVDTSIRIPVTDGQLRYEVWHLLRKVFRRSPTWFHHLLQLGCFEPNPLFYVVPGPIEPWERVPKDLRSASLTAVEVGTYTIEVRLCI
jgi:hypothetical protein